MKIYNKIVVNKVLVGTLLLTSLTSATLPTFEQSINTDTGTTPTDTISQNYDTSIDSMVYNITNTLNTIESMQAKGEVSLESLT